MIDIKNILWDRYIKVTFFLKDNEKLIMERNQPVNGIDYSPDLSIESNFDTTENSNTAKITVYNLPTDIIKKLTAGLEVLVEAGYWNDGEVNKNGGVIYKGVIGKPKGIQDGVNKKYEITCDSNNDEYKDTKINLKAGNGTKASTLINTIVSKLDKLKIGKIELTNDVVYKDGKTLHNNVKEIFKTIAKDCESIFFISNGLVFFQKTNDINRGTLELDLNKVTEITPNEDGYTIKMVFDSKFQEGYKVKLDLKNEYEDWEVKGEFPIIKGSHVMDYRGDASTTIEIKSKLEEKENEIEIKIVSENKPGRKSTKK